MWRGLCETRVRSSVRHELGHHESRLGMLLPCHFFYYCMKCHVRQWYNWMGSGSKPAHCLYLLRSWASNATLHLLVILAANQENEDCMGEDLYWEDGAGVDESCSLSIAEFLFAYLNIHLLFPVWLSWTFHLLKAEFTKRKGVCDRPQRTKIEDHR